MTVDERGAPREGAAPVKIAYCDGPRLRRAILAASDYVSAHRAELDRINIFPVPDGDTGTNLALTMRSVADAVRPLEAESVAEVAGVAAEASVMGARGNSGMLVAHFLSGFSRGLGDRLRAGTSEIAAALETAAGAVQDALERPVEGTILTVVRETAEAARRKADVRSDLYEWLREVRSAAHRSLQRTRLTLPALREAGVVDAGAKGFVNLLEGTLRYIEGRPVGRSETGTAPERGPVRREGGEEEGRWCTQIAVRAGGLPGEEELRERLSGLGTSLLVVRAGDLARVHVHADDPDAVEERVAGWGEVVSRRVEDTRQPVLERTVGVVTDSSSDLPRDWAREHGVEVVPLQLIVGEDTYRDGEEVGPDELLEILRDPDAPVPTTSQAPPRAFLDAYRRATDRGAEEVLGIFLSAALSGTFGSASTAAGGLEDVRVELVDSRSGSLGLGLLVVRAVELLDEGRSLEQVAEELERVRSRSGLLFTVENLDGLLRSGRVGRSRAWLGNLLGLKPVLTLDDEGRAVPLDRVRTRSGARDRMLEAVDRALEDADRCRLGVVHAGLPDFAADLAGEVRRRYRPVDVFVQPLTAVLAAHLGPGAWGLCYQVEG